MYKVGDIVLIKSCAGDAIPVIHVKLLKRIEVKPSKGNTIDWPGYTGWECELTVPEEALMLRKEWSIPFKFPNNIQTFVFDYLIVKKVKRTRKRSKHRRKTI